MDTVLSHTSGASLPPVMPPPNQYEKGQKAFQKSFLFFLVLFLVGAAFWLGYEQGKEKSLVDSQEETVLSPEDAIIVNKGGKDKTIDFALFWKVWEILQDKYVDNSKLDAHELFYGAIDGMLAASGDPYTTFFSPKENKEFNEDISGTFEGIGAEMAIKDNIMTIVAPLEGMPAEKAGLMSGDRVIKINGESASGISLEEAVSKIRGPKGTEVNLTIFHEGEEETRDVTVKRDVILVRSVRFEMKENNTIGFIRISRFGEDTEREFEEAVKQAQDGRVQGLILDLRNNPGGFLETAVAMSSLMLPTGKVVVVEEDGEGRHKETMARGGDVLSGIPTVILINEGSASASEILAGALRDNRDNVRLVGKKSFGKGSVQQLISVGKDTSVKITVARWLTPRLNQIHEVGISPDIEVALTSNDFKNERDPQLEKALAVVKELIK